MVNGGRQTVKVLAVVAVDDGGDDTPELLKAHFTPFCQNKLARRCYGNDDFTWGWCACPVYYGNSAVKYAPTAPVMAAQPEEVRAGGAAHEQPVEAERVPAPLGRWVREAFVGGNGRAGLERGIGKQA